ncbi:DcaP family trimeric outer membrane transporter [Acinetobacter sp.]|uniref:DcaP family trimeric outer membrane transporter n=1 Tax=Acinetobacter sp. TaxID=472 RepID=UPI003918027A
MITPVFKFKFSLLTLAMFTLPTVAVASDQTEIEQLRQEVNDLRSLIEQQQMKSSKINHPVAVQPEAKITNASSQASKNANSFKFYGNVRADASYQAEGSAADRLYNNINKVPLKGNGENSDRLKSTLAATRLGLDINHQVNAKTLNAKLEVDFLGGTNSDNLRIRHAYLNYGNWLVGQTWSNFAIPDYMPETIDALGYVGGAVKRTPQLRYQYQFSPETALILAAEDPKDASSNMRLPALSARLNQQLGNNAKMSLRAMADEKRTMNDKTTAWGIGLGLQYKVNDSNTLKADYYHVKGDSSFVSWSNPGVSKNAAGDILDENEFDSISLGLTTQWNSQWRSTLGYGYMKADVSEAYKQGVVNLTEINKALWQGWANVFYSPTQPLSFGVEYVYGERKAVIAAPNGSDGGEDNRVNLVAIYNF